ncbi:hypothetical protein BDQ12DRAFT_687244 [Crucibulum laeve]|uniref:Uncharacterized protein n=1 Tax=Crucibulum laeve TaxID=68775 RepID=A0A5C3LTF4_9AGAR|nr:hypothetical protein BDQ12DRAFT_687244 [Crucibulum laeve]
MAALYLHNALHSTESSETARGPSYHHSRNLSTVSSTTLHASTSGHSQPTEPLLYTQAPISSVYYDFPDQIPREEEQPPILEWAQTLTLEGDPVSPREKRSLWELSTRRRLKRMRRWRWILVLVKGCWAIYNTVMYFLAFTVYESAAGQMVSLALGLSTGISFALLACAATLLIFHPRLLAHHIPYRTLVSTQSVLHYLSSFFILGPAIVNFVLLFFWRNSPDPELKLAHRCHIDIDIIWPASNPVCVNKSPPWGVWLTLSTARLVLTFIIIVLYHRISSLYSLTTRPSASGRSRRHRHHRSKAYQSVLPTSMMAPFSATSTAYVGPPLPGEVVMQRQLSESTLASTAVCSTSHHNHQPRVKHSSEEEDLPSSGDLGVHGPSEPAGIPAESSLQGAAAASGGDLNIFMNTFRTLMARIDRETEEGLDIAQQSDAASSQTFESESTDPDAIPEGQEMGSFYPPMPPPALGYNEFGQPYPPELEVRMVNGYLRRMPTIESMGSREVGSSIGASSAYSNHYQHRPASPYTGSRPPTRNTLASWSEYTGSGPPSRAGSLTARAEIIAGIGGTQELQEVFGGVGGATEVGEVIGGPGARRDDSPSDYLGVEEVGTAGSRSSSYYTATANSKGSSSGASTNPDIPIERPQNTPSRYPDTKMDSQDVSQSRSRTPTEYYAS